MEPEAVEAAVLILSLGAKTMPTLREEFQELKDKVCSIHAALIGNIQEPDTVKASIMARVEDHEKFIKFWRQFGWALVVSCLTIPPAVCTAVILAVLHLPR